MNATELLIWFIPLPPLLAFLLISLFTYRRRAVSHSLAITSAGISWLIGMVVFWRATGQPDLSTKPFASAIDWLPVGEKWFQVGVQVDPLSAVTLFFVAWTVLMIFIYSVGYHNFGQPQGDHDCPGLPPHGAMIKDSHGHSGRVPSIEPMYSRFFAFISLFAFAMFLLVITDNLLVLYVGWEIMGLCSYLLIGFWYGKKSARDAAVKAFLTTRVGDMFMLLGIAALYSLTGSLNYQAILSNPAVLQMLADSASPVLGLSWAGLVGLLIFIGTVGKSAQFPLHVWLPDAMEGPTPVSAMIHAATMVSAGVYLAIRFFPLLSAGWVPGEPLTAAMTIVAAVGAFTALFAATIAIAQRDIKRVLAYSTISQLGFMIAAIGIGSYVAAVFHLVIHAFFKALLFLGSGSVIHGMEHGVLHCDDSIDPQDMFNMGGLGKRMPVTFWTFLAGGLALSGFPVITAGFWSKDEILSGAFNNGHLAVFITLALAALLTAFYTMRQITLTFLGKPRTRSAEHALESRPLMTLPLVILAVFSITAGWAGIPSSFPLLGGLLPNWFGEFVGTMAGEGGEEILHHSNIPLLTSLFVSLGGLLLGWLVYRNFPAGAEDPLQKLSGLYRLLKNKYWIDEIYSLLLVKPAVWLSEVFTAIWLDGKIIDGALHGIARFGMWLGGSLREVVDTLVVREAEEQMGLGTRNLGRQMSEVQTGRVQRYMLAAAGILLVAAAVVYYVVSLG